MSGEHDFFTAHYRALQHDAALRQRLIDDPAAGLADYFGFMPDGDYRVEAVAQEPDRITILIPSRPQGDPSDEAIDAASRRIFDLLFTDGVGGYLIPDDRLTWVLRDMRQKWSEDHVIR